MKASTDKVCVAVPMQLYAVVLTDGYNNCHRPYLVPSGMSSHARRVLEPASRIGRVLIADKSTLLANGFDLCEEDFNTPLPLPECAEPRNPF